MSNMFRFRIRSIFNGPALLLLDLFVLRDLA